MNDTNLISIDDDSLDNVTGGFGLLSCLIIKPVQIVSNLFSALLGGCCAPAKSECAPKYDDCAPRRRGC